MHRVLSKGLRCVLQSIDFFLLNAKRLMNTGFVSHPLTVLSHCGFGHSILGKFSYTLLERLLAQQGLHKSSNGH